MIKTIFVAATGTNVGKTYTALKIMELLCANGIKAAPFKPIETGVLDAPLDASKLLEKYHSLYGNDSLDIEDICPYRFALPAAPYVAKNNQNIELDTLKESLRKLQLNADIVLMEAAGGLMTPIEKDFFMIDLAADLADFTVLISHCGLGCINDALLSKKALEDREMPHALLFNRMDGDDFDAISRPFLQSRFEKLLEINDLDNLLTELFK